MIREINLVFIKLHIRYHPSNEEFYGVGLVEELARQRGGH